MTDKEKDRPLWPSFIVEDEKGKLNIVAPPGYVGDYTDKVGQNLDPDNPGEKAVIEDLQSTARAFRIAEEQINPDRLKETAQHMRENMPVVDMIAPGVFYYLIRKYEGTEDEAGTVELDIENPPEWYDPSKTYQINFDKAMEKVTNAVQAITEAFNEKGRDFWEHTAHYVWVHLMAHTLLEMVDKYGGWEELWELPDLEDQFNEWLLEDEHMGPFNERYMHVVQMYADQTAHSLAEMIEGKGDLFMEALAFEPVPDHGHLSDIEGMVHTDNSRPFHETVIAIAEGGGRFQGEEWPVAPLPSGGQLVVYPPYEDFNPSLMSPEELAEWQAKMQDVVYDMNDLTADMLDIATITHLESRTKTGHFFNLDLNEVLQMRGIKPKKKDGYTAGYRPEDYALIRRHVAKLCYIRPEGVEQEVTMLDEKGRRDRKRIAYRHPLLVIGGEKTVQDVESGLYEERTLELRLSPLFAEKLASISPQIALMPKVALECHPQKQWLEKRLIRYYAHLWRNRQQSASYNDPVTVAHLLESVGLEIPSRNQHRTRDRLEKALDFITEKGAAGGWQYVGWDESRADRRGWVKEWQQARVIVEPPNVIPDYYRERIADKAPKKEQESRRPKGQKKEVGDIGQAIRAKRTAEGLSMSQLAEQLEVSPSQVSRWEAGKTNPRGKALKKIEAWLGGGQK